MSILDCTGRPGCFLSLSLLLSVGSAQIAHARSCDIDPAKNRLKSALQVIINKEGAAFCAGIPEVIAAADAVSRFPQSCFTPDSPPMSKISDMAARYRKALAECNRSAPSRSEQADTIDKVLDGRRRTNSGLDDAKPGKAAPPAAPPQRSGRDRQGQMPVAQSCARLVRSYKVSSMCEFKEGVPMYANVVAIPAGEAQNCPARVNFTYTDPETGRQGSRSASVKGDSFHTCMAPVRGITVTP